MDRKYLALVFPLVASVAGCGLVSGLSDLEVGPASGSDASTEAGAVIDGAVGVDASDAGVAPDVSVVIPDGGCGCGITVPPGFSPILYGGDSDLCPKASTPEKVVVSPQALAAGGACACTCTIGGCTNLKLSFYDTPNCSNLFGTTSANATCQLTPGVSGNVDSVRVSGSGSANVTCATIPPAFPKPYGGEAGVCTPEQSTACASFCSPPPGLGTCFVAPGDVSCPQTLPKRTVIAQSVTDARTCAGCGCSVANPVCNVALQSYSDNICATAVGVVSNFVTDVCTPQAVGTDTIAKITPAGTCSATPGSVTGTTTPVNLRTVCCK